MSEARSRLDLLVTGFGPFPHVRINPTAALARAVARRLARSGVKAEALVLETSYSGGLPALRACLDARRPGAVLMLGLAARARFVRVELFARGFSSRLHVDATGAVPSNHNAPTLPLRTQANAEGALAAFRMRSLRARLSPSAGRYLCDASYALALGHAATDDIPVIFIHIPWPRPRPGTRRIDAVAGFRPDPVRLAAALAATGSALARSGRRPVPHRDIRAGT